MLMLRWFESSTRHVIKKISLTAIPIGFWLYQQWVQDRIKVEGIPWDGHFSDDLSTVEDQFPEWVEHKGFREFLTLIRDWQVYGGHGGDEYGNCTLYIRCPLFGIVWWYPTGHYQNEVEMTQPGIDKWIDKVYYGGCDDWCKHET
jgi:hypothetical protein